MAQILFNFLSPIKSIAIYIDSIVFGLIDNCFEIIMGFANSEFYKLDIIDDIRKKIYFVITLIAMFRLAFLLINSLINPDKLNDESQGLSKVAFNFVIMLVLLVITPMLFNEALDIQETVVTNNLITGIFSDAPVGSTSTSSDYKKVAKDSSRKMKDLVIGSLIYPDPAIADFKEADKKYEKKNNCGGKCEKAVEAYNKMLDPNGEGMKYTILSKYVGVTEKVDDEEIFVYNYQMFLTLICAGFIVYILLSFSFDLAKRFIELNLLMVLSPLFIATFIDPKSAKSGPFNNWLKALGKSYVGLFLRLGALAVMLLFIKIISSEELDTSSLGFIGKIILLFAVLTFCKNIPKWLGDLLGTGDAMGGLGLGKKIEDTPFVGKGLMGAARKAGHMASGAAVGAAVGAAKGGYNTLKDRSKRRGEAGLGYFRNRDKNGMDKEALRNARKQAYARDGNAANGGFFKQMGAGMLGAGLAGGRTGVKADNIKGAFQGSVKAADNFGKTIGNRGGTVKGWVDGKLDAFGSKQALKFGSPSELYEAREQVENDAKAKLIYSGATAAKPPFTEGNQIAVSKKGQIHMQSNAVDKSTNSKGEFLDTAGAVIAPSDNAKFAMGKTYQAITCNGCGEGGITNMRLDPTGDNIVVTLAGDNALKYGSTFTVSVDSAIKGNFGKEFGLFADTPEGQQAFNTAYYNGQQTSLQNYEQANAAMSKIGESISAMNSSISTLNSTLNNSVRALPSAISNAITAAPDNTARIAAIQAAINNASTSPADKDALQEMLTQAKYISEQESERLRLMEEHETYKKQRDKDQVVISLIPGDTVEDKKIAVERGSNQAKGLVTTSEDDK